MRWVRAVGLVLLFVVAGCSKKEDPLRDPHVAEPVRIAAAYAALVEQPDADRVLLLGDDARSFSAYFKHAGVTPCTTAGGRFDIVFLTCGEMSLESCAKAKSLLSDGGVMAWFMDLRGVDIKSFRAMFASFDFEDVHLWMPGKEHWLLVGRSSPRRTGLSAMMDLFTRESAFEDLARARCGGLPEVFASYAGARSDVEPAFSSRDGDTMLVRPEYFLAKAALAVDWIDAGKDVDPDISKKVFSEIRSAQVVRRLVIDGDLAAEEAKDKMGEAKAVEIWAKALKRNPGDTFLLERLDNLERNAEGFLKLGKLLQAMKCYETMILIRPNDPKSVHNFGVCLKRLGKVDLAEKILKRAEFLSQQLERDSR